LSLPVINSHNSWSRLEECWLGDVYPQEWYEHLDPEIRDIFQKLTEITQQDLNSIQVMLESHDVIVRRPLYKDIENHVIDNGMLLKPEITPRDNYVVIGNTLYSREMPTPQWDYVLDQYRSDPVIEIKTRPAQFITGGNVVRLGRDIIIDTDKSDWTYQNQWPEYRVHMEKNGGHLDACFAILKPGLILANNYFDGYNRNFPDWEIIYLDNPTYQSPINHGKLYPSWNGKFWDTAVGTNKMFNDHIIQHAQDWVGNYTETYFELNCLSIDESNVIMLAENEALAKTLQRHGITVHWVPFRTRSFWDGAMHCLTVDIRRQSSMEDLFPERG